ncbi:MAG: hypothetical protein ABIF28_19100, partial [Pseudomonadota bacterium]
SVITGLGGFALVEPSLFGEIGVAGYGIFLGVKGVGRGIDRGIDAVKVFTQRQASSAAAQGATTVIGRVNDLKSLQAGEQSLLERLPNLGGPKANWAQNSGVLREEMGRGVPIRDASPGDTAGQFLNAERGLLRDRGWTFDSKTNFWMPPKP